MEDYLKQDFFNTASTDSMTWMENAEHLKLSADLVYEGIVATYEAYKKEKNKKRELDFSVRRINWKHYKMGHGISEICNECYNGLSEKEIELLERLESYILWIGKYPVAKKIEVHVAESDNKYFDSNDKEDIDTLFEKIKLFLIEENERNRC